MDQASKEEKLEALERTIQEIEALQAIYGDDDDDDTSSKITICSQSEYSKAQHIIDTENKENENIPTLEIEIKLQHEHDQNTLFQSLRFVLPPGYPAYTTAIPSLSSSSGTLKLTKAAQQYTTCSLTTKSKELIGVEALLELVQYAQDILPDVISQFCKIDAPTKEEEDDDNNSEEKQIGRRWIWVHHITNTQRIKDICSEARSHHLSGYIKSGYPGIVLIEGSTKSCNNFVTWIKGNKSRPGGGFGRNWGHHVRGEIDFDFGEMRCFKKEEKKCFEEVEDLKVLSAHCKNVGLEDEFLKYVLQH